MTVAKLREMVGEATVLPWRWHGQIGPSHSIGLRTVGNGVLYVMGAKRMGMQGAEFTFWSRKPDEHWGWNGDMQTASEAAVREVPYRGDIVDIDNPNARLIVAAVNNLPALLEVAELADELVRAIDEDRQHANKVVRLQAALARLEEAK